MSRTTRLIQLLAEIRLHEPPVTAGILAGAMNVSERTIYRDIDSLREVQAIADPSLAKAAEHVLAKLHASLPPRLKGHLKHSVLHAKRFKDRPEIKVDSALIRQAAWKENALDIEYIDANGKLSKRRILPLSMVYLDEALVLISYCQLRQATRAFRMDRLKKVTPTEESFYPKRVKLLKEALITIRGTNH